MYRSLVIIIFSATLLLKIGALIQEPRLLDEGDAVFPVTLRTLTRAAVVLEVCIIIFAASHRSVPKVAFVCLAFIVTASVYRAITYATIGKRCTCLGQLSSWLPAIIPWEENIVNFFAFTIAVSSLAILGKQINRSKTKLGFRR